MGSFTDSNLTDEGTNRDFGQVVTYERPQKKRRPLILKVFP